MLGVLRNAIFAKLFTAQIVALLGTGLLTVALGLLAYDLAGARAGAVLGTALAIKMIAYVFLAPLASALVGGFSRKQRLKPDVVPMLAWRPPDQPVVHSPDPDRPGAHP